MAFARVAEAQPYSYEVTPGWIQGVLQTGAVHSRARRIKLALDAERFRAILPLLRHGAMGATGPIRPGADVFRLSRLFIGANPRQFVTDARKIAADPSIDIRRNGVCLRTENRLTGRFVPPVASGVRPALTEALVAIDAALGRHRDEAGPTVICALLGYQILLTIHPFRDANGRTARMFFAAKVMRHLGPAPTALLGLMLLHRAGAHQYHQACWALRTGSAGPIVDLFVDGEDLARDLLSLGDASGLPAAGLVERCRLDLQRLL